MSYLEPDADGIKLRIRVIPRSSQSAIAGVHDDHIRVKLNAPPVDGAANRELVKVVSKALGIRKGSVSIISGVRSKSKTLFLADLSPAEARTRLAEYLES